MSQPVFLADQSADSERDIAALEELILDNSLLEELETLLADFNVFEAIGVVRQETRHSNFLAFLLNPNQNHGLGDEFVTRFLQRAIRDVPRGALPVSPLELDVWSLDAISVFRESDNIDVLLVDDVHHFVVVIENKIDSTEHSDQLSRYRETVALRFPAYRFLGLYLTPDGDRPSDDHYLACSYAVVTQVAKEVLRTRRSTLGSDIQVLLRHYIQMLERHVMTDTHIAKLCREIYQKHRRALDLILEHRPDQQSEIFEFLKGLIAADDRFQFEKTSKGNVRFSFRDIDPPALRVGTYLETGRILFFEIYNSSAYKMPLRLYVGTGEPVVRQRLFDMARAAGKPFNNVGGKLAPQWQAIYTRPLLPRPDPNASLEETKERIRVSWDAFRSDDLEHIRTVLRSQDWLFA